jgi:hypothetical protein
MIGGRRLNDVASPTPGAPTSGALRVLRGTAVGATAMGLALAGHVAGGGSLPALRTSFAVFSLAAAGSIALSGRRWTLAELVTVLLGVQVFFHVAFGNHAMLSGAHSHAAHGLSVSMVTAHLLAAFVAALVLRRGESWCWQLMAFLRRPVQAVRAFGTVSVPDLVVTSLRAGDGPRSLRSLMLADVQPRRGPPALLAS